MNEIRSGLTAIKTLLSRDPCGHATTAIQMIDAMLAEQPAQQEPAYRCQPYSSVPGAKVSAPVDYFLTPQPPAQPGVLARKWILHGGFADVASFDVDGFPSFYWEESAAKFKAGELSAPCKGKNCGSLNGWLHSAECRAEHEDQYTAHGITKGGAA